MAGSQKVFLRIFAIVGDGDDLDAMPDRVPVSGSGRLIPTLATGSGDIAPGPDSIHEVRLIEPIPFLIVDGMLTYDGKPYIWLPVPTGQWQWRIAFDTVRVGDQFRSLREYAFPLTAATPAQIADPGYPGVNIAQYATGAWEPGTVNLTADAIQQINIMLGRASNAAGDAEQSRQAAEVSAQTLAQRVETGTRELGVTSDGKLYFLDQADVGVPLRVDTSVGTRVFLGDVMIHGDTGWRNVAADLRYDWTAEAVAIRRVGSTVEVRIMGLNGQAATANTFFVPPTGFVPKGPGGMRILATANPGAVMADRVNIGITGTNSQIWRTDTSIREAALSSTYFTDDDWPTELPGTPA